MSKILTIKEAAEKLGLRNEDVNYIHKLKDLGYIDFEGKGRNRFVDENKVSTMLNEMRDLAKYEIMADLIFVLWDMFKREHWSFPGTLRGQIGELKVLTKLIDEFSTSRILYFGGTTPKVDIILDGKKIQVKTQYPEEPAVKNSYSKKYGVKAFGSPTIRIQNRKSLDEEPKKSIKKWDSHIVKRQFGFDYLILSIMRNKIPEFYVFDISEVEKYFKSFVCWSGKYGDVTVCCIEQILNPEKATVVLKRYPPKIYRPLFENAKDAWDKINPIKH